jgi:Uma2 family endonuclease
MTTAVLDTPIAKIQSKRHIPLLPYKLIDRFELPVEMRIAASFNDYIELLSESEYKIEYSNGHLISIFETDNTNQNILMGYATLTHEELVGNLIFALNLLFRSNRNYHILGSNTAIYVADNLAGYNPDVVVRKGEAVMKPHKFRKKTVNCLSNPSIVIEVLSQGTREYDLIEKFNNYKKIPSLEQIIFVEQYWSQVMTYIRQPNSWLFVEKTDISASIPVENSTISLADIYQKIDF